MSKKILKGTTRLKASDRPTFKKGKITNKLGFLTHGKRKMGAYRLRHETHELLEDILRKGRKEVSAKLSKSDVLEIGLYLLSKLTIDEFESVSRKCLK